MQRHSRIPALAAALMLSAGVGAAPALHAAVQTRSFRQALPATEGGEVRVSNLAGRLEILPGQGREVVVEATIHAEAESAAETQRLLQGMKWIKSHDTKGRAEWALSYPVEKYTTYIYPSSDVEERGDLPELLSFLHDFGGHPPTIYRGKRVRIYSSKRGSAPTLFANLRITLPAGGHVAIRNIAGAVRGGDLEGTLAVATGRGDIQIASHSGQLTLDSGSGAILVKRLVGNGLIDTGSGNVVVQKISVGSLSVDTGSGSVVLQDGEAGKVVADTGSGGVRILGVEVEELAAETGSGDVRVSTSLVKTRRITAKTGSGNVYIKAGPNASFQVESHQGSGDLRVGYTDAVLRRSGHKVVGARRGDGRTSIYVETGSGDCRVSPEGP